MAFLFVWMITFDRMKTSLLGVALMISSMAGSQQLKFSIGSDASFLRNLSPKQKFWAVGQTLQVNFHFSGDESAYAWLNYYTEGKYKNNFTASAKSILTTPQQIAYTASGQLRFRQISLGWKHYFKGAYNEIKGVNIYGTAGFGLLFARVQNSFSPSVNTVFYATPTKAGVGTLKKLTFDLGLGSEMLLGGNIYAYADVRTWLPASSNESAYLHHQRNLPLPIMLCAGLRILFDFDY